MTPETKKFIELLESELGYAEKASGYTKFGKWYNSVESDSDYTNQPWCDMYISWAAKKLGYEDWIGQFAWTVSHAQWFKEQDAWGHTPAPGALVFYDWGGSDKISKIDHVGVVTRVEGKRIHTIEGNIDGGVAKRKVRDQSKVVGYGYPEKVKERLEAQVLDLGATSAGTAAVQGGPGVGLPGPGIGIAAPAADAVRQGAGQDVGQGVRPGPATTAPDTGTASPRTAAEAGTPSTASAQSGSVLTLLPPRATTAVPDAESAGAAAPQSGKVLALLAPRTPAQSDARTAGKHRKSADAAPAAAANAAPSTPSTPASPSTPGKHRKPETQAGTEAARPADAVGGTPVSAVRDLPALPELGTQALVGSLVLAAVAVLTHAKARLRLAHAVRVPRTSVTPVTTVTEAQRAHRATRNTRFTRLVPQHTDLELTAPAVHSTEPADTTLAPALAGLGLTSALQPADVATATSRPTFTDLAILTPGDQPAASVGATPGTSVPFSATGRSRRGLRSRRGAAGLDAAIASALGNPADSGDTPRDGEPGRGAVPYQGRRRRLERLPEDYGSFKAEAPLRGRRHRTTSTPRDTRPSGNPRPRRQPLSAPVYESDVLVASAANTPQPDFRPDVPLRGRRHRATSEPAPSPRPQKGRHRRA
ncbi:CHAP domain-containing protein [Sinosporangium album]|uniref:CHAP domain-containing protein n=1 Tax=Sinosporangium album TaxID=504805 RepID=A0A1G7RTJ8_9ACTN|nr:CHAP domain-containing protein [Sinosporangium album]SDG14062.1 CHAP domain-containing protein [Sinosporangium album]